MADLQVETDDQFKESYPDKLVIILGGTGDTAALEILQAKTDAIIDKFEGKYIIFKCPELTFLNSHTIGYFIALLDKYPNKVFAFSELQGHVEDVFKLTGMHNLFKLFKNTADALTSVQS